MKNFILTRILGAVGSMLDGYKTKIGGAGSIMLGVLGVVKVIFPDQLAALPDAGIETSLGMIVAGFSVLGLGGKSEKTKTAIIEQTAAIQEQNRLVEQQNRILEQGPLASHR